MNMKDLPQYYAASMLYVAMYGINGDLYPSLSQWTTYDPPRLKGRKRLTKKQRKHKKQ